MGELASRLAGHATATALLEGDDRISYGELSDRVLRTAAALRHNGLASGARVAVIASSCADGIVASLGVQAAGLLPVMLSTQSPLAELERRFADVDPAFVLFASATPCDLPTGVDVARPALSRATDYRVLDADPMAAVDVEQDDPAVVLYTSGVSGLPKPVVLTYRNLDATRAGLVNAPGAGIDASTVAYAGLPIAHVFGLNSIIGTVLSVGGKLVLNNGFDPHEVAELVARHRVTAISAVPLMWKGLAATADRDLFATVARATYAAAPMPPAIRDAVEHLIGLRVAGGFGHTETAGTVVHDDPTDPHPGTVGRPLGDTQIRVIDDGEDAVIGDTGEIW
ncbi:MAG: long-chain acyl-CoA synthetase, partial [Actinomycetota bacterium]